MFPRDDESRDINHHGTTKPATTEDNVKVIDMKIPQKIEPEQLFAPPKMKKMDLISRNEKTQVEVTMILVFI